MCSHTDCADILSIWSTGRNFLTSFHLLASTSYIHEDGHGAIPQEGREIQPLSGWASQRIRCGGEEWWKAKIKIMTSARLTDHPRVQTNAAVPAEGFSPKYCKGVSNHTLEAVWAFFRDSAIIPPSTRMMRGNGKNPVFCKIHLGNIQKHFLNDCLKKQ